MESYPTPHLFGIIDYSGSHSFAPDGDTVHLFDPVLLDEGEVIRPTNGKLKVWMPGNQKPRTIVVKTPKDGSPFVPIRFEGIDAPEEHYRATPFKLQEGTREVEYPIDKSKQYEERSQPLWKPATEFVLGVLTKARYTVVELDREVSDRYNRVLGYVHSGDSRARKKIFVTLELLKRGLAFPFVFESAGDRIKTFLEATAKARSQNLGVWKHYKDEPLTYQNTFPDPKRYTDAEPATQAYASLNLPMVFRRIVDSYQLKGLSLTKALQKYDAIDYHTGKLVTGDKYHQIPIKNRIWAQHRYQ